MSLDLIAYFTKKPPAISSMGSPDAWLLNVDPALPIEADDISPPLQPYLTRCRWQTNISLEGEHTPDALAALADLKSELLRSHDARIYDPQTDTVTSSAGTEAVLYLASSDDEATHFQLCIYFENADHVDKNKISMLLDIIQELLPEALPHRYGHFEPPEWRWDDGGKDAYLDRWERLDPPFTIGKTPVRYVFSSFDPQPNLRSDDFQAGEFNFQFRPNLAEQPRKLAAVMRLAERFSVELDAFYAALLCGQESEGPFWNGLYPAEHLLLILGPPMLELWPEFHDLSRPLGTRHRVATVEGGLPTVRPPKDLCYPTGPNDQAVIKAQEGTAGTPTEIYAAKFPFPKRNPYISG